MGLQTLRRTDGQERPWRVTAADNARLVRQVIEEIWNGGDLDLADRCSPPTTSTTAGSSRTWSAVRRRSRSASCCTARPSPSSGLPWSMCSPRGRPLRCAGPRTDAPRRPGSVTRRTADRDTLLGMTFGRVIEGQIVESWTCWEPGGGEEARHRAEHPGMGKERVMTWDRSRIAEGRSSSASAHARSECSPTRARPHCDMSLPRRHPRRGDARRLVSPAAARRPSFPSGTGVA